MDGVRHRVLPLEVNPRREVHKLGLMGKYIFD
jgi:hypothetical protein